MKTIINFAIKRNPEHTITYIFLYVDLFVTSNQVDQ